ncbi:putative transcriptional regulator protein, LysR family [Mesorhizobium plurifarium]|uniref:Putative transcriptional regulator protein, LysR family n=1 Tax=Mesorhizobium plurifarium TaxID=69974 RepID=A0A090GIM7_MESPL|nr:putative transcriptional regulator protein, LysR family [Mesorhizobium plurifarium]
MEYDTVVHQANHSRESRVIDCNLRKKKLGVRYDPARPLSGRLPPLIMLRAFEAAARTGSMRKAATDIGISHTVVSRHLQGLETWIGWKLLDAGPRGVTLTPEGKSLHDVTSVAFQSIANISAQLRAKAGTDELHIWCFPGLATRWLIPRLDEIREVVSSGEVLIRATDRIPDFARGEADIMIGFGDGNRALGRVFPLLRPRMFPVASPSWVAKYGMPGSVEELTCLPLIHEESYAQWTSWLTQAGLRLDRPLKGPRLWDANLGFDAAMAGQGVALTTNLMAAGELNRGDLVELFDTDISVGGYYLATAQNAQDRRIDLFRVWITEALAACETVRLAAISVR